MRTCGFLRRKSGAFTLVELLIVIAIVAILAAILFPVFSQAKAKSKQAACLNNCRQIGNAVLMYLQDYSETFPKGEGFSAPAANGLGAITETDPKHVSPRGRWPWYFAPYLKDGSVFICPECPATVEKLQVEDWTMNDSMGYNYDGLTREATLPPRKRSDIDQPAETYVIFDNGDAAMCPGTNTFKTMLANMDLDLPITKRIPFRHQKLASVIFADGHTKMLDAQTMLTRKADNVAPWMTEWKDCDPNCTTPVFGPGGDFDPSIIP